MLNALQFIFPCQVPKRMSIGFAVASIVPEHVKDVLILAQRFLDRDKLHIWIWLTIIFH